jgi:murein DD-endopeptidase MepM/ murein hydrolase activator NlpD
MNKVLYLLASMFKKISFFRITKILLIYILLLILAAYIFSKLSSPVTKNIDNYTYTLPFEKGTKHKIVQGYGGLFSHKNIAALDFEMPEGTAIYSTREGTILHYKDDSDEGGPFAKYKNKANYIIVKHADGSFGCYWHLKKDGVVIKIGAVSKGQLIGYSGATGFTLRPHLHFSVKRELNYEMDSFVQTKFETTNGIEILQNGNTYQRPVK